MLNFNRKISSYFHNIVTKKDSLNYTNFSKKPHFGHFENILLPTLIKFINFAKSKI